MLTLKKNPISRKDSIVFPTPQEEQKTKVIKASASYFRFLNFYLSYHGLGFRPKRNSGGRNLIRSIVPILSTIICDGNLLYMVFLLLWYFCDHGIKESKSELAIVTFLSLNIVLRFQIYNARERLDKTLESLCRVYDKVGCGRKSIARFKIKLLFLLFLSDAFLVFYTGVVLFDASPHIVRVYFYGVHSYSIFYFSFAMYIHTLAFPAITADFSSVCFSLREILTAFGEKILKEPGDVRLIEEYAEITHIINQADVLMQPLMTTVFTFLLSGFQRAYLGIFIVKNAQVVYSFMYMSLVFAHFLVICAASSSVKTAVHDVTVTFQCASTEISDSRRFQFFLHLNKEFSGLKVLDSIVVDKSLVLSSAGALLTYGILLATFNFASIN